RPARVCTARVRRGPSRSSRSSARTGCAGAWARTESSNRSISARCRTLTPRRSRCASCMRTAIRRTSGRSSRSCGAGCRARTSADVCLVAGGRAERASERTVDGLPIHLPTVDLHTVGAGGGSLVWTDAGGALRVGPQSAGANPGPACYGRGGTQGTVTDANLLLGRLPQQLAGGVELDRAAAERALAGIDPAAVVGVVNTEMLRALRVV